MRSPKKASFYLFTTALFLVPAAAITACGDDDDAPPPTTLLDGSANDARSNANDGQTSSDATPDVDSPQKEGGTDAGADADADTPDADTPDADTPDADADAPDADASTKDADADAEDPKPTSLDDGTFQITAWSCTHAGGTIDILTKANDLGITEIDQTITAAAAQTDAIYTADCKRSTAQTVAYPEAGKVTFTGAPAYTCTATCDPATCTSGTQSVVIDTYGYTKTPTSFTGTRVLGADDLTTDAGQPTLPKAAGCAVGDLETATFTKK